jgi:hypothetical protein
VREPRVGAICSETMHNLTDTRPNFVHGCKGKSHNAPDAERPAELLDETKVPTADEVPDALSSKLTSLTIVFSCWRARERDQASRPKKRRIHESGIRSMKMWACLSRTCQTLGRGSRTETTKQRHTDRHTRRPAEWRRTTCTLRRRAPRQSQCRPICSADIASPTCCCGRCWSCCCCCSWWGRGQRERGMSDESQLQKKTPTEPAEFF